MAFIDILAYSLLAVSFAGFLLLYAAVSFLYCFYVKKQREFSSKLKGVSVPLGILGLYMLIAGIWGGLTWPLPGSYNILFFDPLTSFGILLIAFYLSVRYELKLEYVGFLGLMMGVVAIWYGISGYSLGMTAAPIVLLLMYLFYGLAGVFSYPVLLMASTFSPGQKSIWTWFRVAFALLCISLFIGSALSGVTALAAIPAHLATPP